MFVSDNIFFTEDPKDFLIDYLGQLKDSKDNHTQGPCLFNESNLDSVFGILDPTNEGYVSYDQYKEGALRFNICASKLYLIT
jgi:hypothetical protein